ncbi:DUF1385 domain-containing protein [Candidatus Woesearchaeota archaeon]|nr:DUF1385 domain-containing protein [Candidatus Woesearchaeota archaeon]
MSEKYLIGGQAVMEGVMMRSPKKTAIVVRLPSKKLVYKVEDTKSFADKSKILKLPFLRGVIQLIDMLVIGTKALNFSANKALDEGESKEKESFGFWPLFGSIFFALIFAIAIFKFLPLLATQLIYNNLGLLRDTWAFNSMEGIIKISMFIGYVFAISFMKDVKRVFMYHGAEHKTVYCYEAGEPLTVKNVKKYSTLHPRCGTSFIIIVLIMSVVVYSFLPLNLSFFEKFAYRLLLLPVISGMSYETIKFAGKRKFTKFLSYPGLFVQKITTRQPTDDQIEVAIAALKKTL